MNGIWYLNTVLASKVVQLPTFVILSSLGVKANLDKGRWWLFPRANSTGEEQVGQDRRFVNSVLQDSSKTVRVQLRQPAIQVESLNLVND